MRHMAVRHTFDFRVAEYYKDGFVLSEWYYESECFSPEYPFETMLLITVHFRSISFKPSSFGSLFYAQKTASRLKRTVENK